MAFEANKITREHVLKAVKRINKEKLQLITSKKFDAMIDGIAYPPKDLLRFAHEEMNGENSQQLIECYDVFTRLQQELERLKEKYVQ